MVLFALVMLVTLLYLLALVTWGRRHSMRSQMLITAVVLNILGLAVPLMGYTAIFLILLWCAFIATVVAAVSPRWSWLAGTAASPWFLAPHLAWNAFTASPDYVAAYGYIPWQFLGLSLFCGSIGATLGATICWLAASPTVSQTTPPAPADGGA
jgi:hypothetical protein